MSVSRLHAAGGAVTAGARPNPRRCDYFRVERGHELISHPPSPGLGRQVMQGNARLVLELAGSIAYRANNVIVTRAFFRGNLTV